MIFLLTQGIVQQVMKAMHLSFYKARHGGEKTHNGGRWTLQVQRKWFFNLGGCETWVFQQPYEKLHEQMEALQGLKSGGAVFTKILMAALFQYDFFLPFESP